MNSEAQLKLSGADVNIITSNRVAEKLHQDLWNEKLRNGLGESLCARYVFYPLKSPREAMLSVMSFFCMVDRR